MSEKISLDSSVVISYLNLQMNCILKIPRNLLKG